MKKMTKWKRVLTLGLVLAMAVGQPATAMAAEPSGEDFALAEDGAVDPGLELLRQAADAPQTADDEAFETVAEEAEPVAWQAAMENLQAKLNNGEQPTDEEVNTALSSVSGSDLKTISDSDYEVKRYRSVSGNDASLGYISITNRATGNKEEDYLYAALITPTAEQARTTTPVIVLASRIKPGDTTNLYKAWTAEYERVSLDNSKSYTLVLGRAEGGYDMGVVGWYEDYEVPGTIKAVSEVQVDRLITAAEAVDPGAAIYEDGYTGIEMKAVVQKNQNVKITWKKKDASGTQYKGFKLYGIKEDGTEFDKVVLNNNVTAASCIIKAADVKKAPMVYLLECYTDRSASGEPAKRYVTVAAPYLLAVQNGYTQGSFDFSFGRNVDTDYHNYRLDMALKNAVYNPAKRDNNGFRDEWSQFCEATDYFYNDNEWAITAKNKMRFATATYTNEKLNLQAGKAVFARVRSTYQLGGLMVTSAPSNVINVKYGPEKCDTLCIAGVKYNAQNASKNIERATSHIKYWMSGEEYDQSNYVHNNGTDADAKSGMVFFVGKNDSSQIKGYDLLRSDSPYGNYKKVKFYALNNKMLIKTDYNNEFWSVNGPVYAMQFNNFPAEKEYYYAVRAVGKAGNAAGGMDDGVYNCTRPDKVSENEAVAMGLDAASISIAWVHDDCVKQYWIYREDRELVPDENGLVKPTTSPWKKLAANSGVKSVKFEGETYKYNVFKDTKQIIPDRTYYYYIRPVVDVKKAANASEDYNWDLMSDSIPGMASATYTQVKALNPANYSVGSVQLSLTTIKNITNYRIWRAEVAGNVTALTDGMKLAPETLKMEDVIGMTRPSSDGTVQWKFVAQQAPANPSVGGKAMKILDDSVTVGHYYFYLVQTTTDQSAALNYTYSKRIRNIPLAPTNLKASYRNSSKGARVTFQANPRDKDYIGNGALWYYVRWGSHDWVRATQVSGVNFRLDDDTGMSGGERTYIVAAFYGGAPNSGGIKGGEASVKFTKVNRIDLNGSFNLYEGDINEITARAYAGDTAMDGIRIEVDGYDSSVIKVERVDDSNNKFKITAYDGAAGKETNLTFKAGDYSRTVKVRVYAKANKPKK